VKVKGTGCGNAFFPPLPPLVPGIMPDGKFGGEEATFFLPFSFFHEPD